MNIQILNYSTLTDAMNNHNHCNNIQGERAIKRLKTEHFQSFDNKVIYKYAPFRDLSNDFRVHDHNGNHNRNKNNAMIHRLCNPNVKSLLNNKKLYLVLDLDNTLLNSTRLENLTFEEEYLNSRANKKGTNLFRLDGLGLMTKLRPFVRQFLSEASKLFEMCIYTMGNRTYALEMAKILDPENKYFKSRIISKDDCLERDYKGLDVLHVPESLVLVLDDAEVVWKNHKDNLILMDRYIYFQSSCYKFGFKNHKSLSMLKRDEDEFDATLATTLRVLRRIHQDFFETNTSNNYNSQYAYNRDVRQVLKTTKKGVLNDCKIVFSEIFPTNFVASNHCLWKMAEQLGATCSTKLDSSVTHVVSIDRSTEKSVWAVKDNKYLVHPRWIEAANYLWRRQLEHKFPVKNVKPSTRLTLKSNNVSRSHTKITCQQLHKISYFSSLISDLDTD